MTAVSSPAPAEDGAPLARPRHRRAFRLAVRQYVAQLREDWPVTLPALLIPPLGTCLAWFCPPLVIAALLDRFADGGQPSAAELRPYLLAFATVWILGELVWRLGIHFVNRAVTRGEAKLQVRALDTLFEKDLAFFHDNFAGSLTKKVMGYGTAYEVFVSSLAFQVSASLLPLGFVGVVLWHYSPWIFLFLLLMVAITVAVVAPLILRRQKLVDAREAASNLVAGHVADTLTNVDAVRLFSREGEESATHAVNVDHWRALALRSWDYQNRRIDLLTSPLYVATNVVGVVLAITLADGGRFDLAAVFVTFTYFARVHRGHVGVQPDLPQHREPAVDRGPVHRAAARRPGGGRPARARPARASRTRGSSSATSGSPTRAATSRCSPASTCASSPASGSAWSATRAAASRRSPGCCCARPTSTPARSRSAGRTSPGSARPTCAPRSRTSPRTR